MTTPELLMAFKPDSASSIMAEGCLHTTEYMFARGFVGQPYSNAQFKFADLKILN